MNWSVNRFVGPPPFHPVPVVQGMRIFPSALRRLRLGISPRSWNWRTAPHRHLLSVPQTVPHHRIRLLPNCSVPKKKVVDHRSSGRSWSVLVVPGTRIFRQCPSAHRHHRLEAGIAILRLRNWRARRRRPVVPPSRHHDDCYYLMSYWFKQPSGCRPLNDNKFSCGRMPRRARG